MTSTNASQGPDGLKGKKDTAATPGQEKAAAKPETAPSAGNPDANDDPNTVPPVTADVDEAPRGVRYGAAIILALAFGVGCYMWIGDGDSSIVNSDARIKAAATEQYFNQPGANDPIGTSETPVPDPFNSPYEPSLDYGNGYYDNAPADNQVVMTSNVANEANVGQVPKSNPVTDEAAASPADSQSGPAEISPR